MKETFIRCGTQHEVRTTEIARRGLKKLGFELQKSRSLKEPLIVIEENEKNKKAMDGISLGSEDFASRMGGFLNETTKGYCNSGPFLIPENVEAVVNKVETGGKITYEIDFFQTTDAAACVSDDQIVMTQVHKQKQ